MSKLYNDMMAKKTTYIKGADEFKLDNTGGFTPVDQMSYDTIQKYDFFKDGGLAATAAQIPGAGLKNSIFGSLGVPQIGSSMQTYLSEQQGAPYTLDARANNIVNNVGTYRSIDNLLFPDLKMPSIDEYLNKQAEIGNTLDNQVKASNLGTANATTEYLTNLANKQKPVLAGLNASELWGTGLQLGGLAMSYLNQKDNLALAKESNRQVQQNFDLAATEAGYETDPVTGKKSTFKTRTNRLASNALK